MASTPTGPIQPNTLSHLLADVSGPHLHQSRSPYGIAAAGWHRQVTHMTMPLYWLIYRHIGHKKVVMARAVAIWVFGLLASAIIGGLVGSRLEPMYSYDWEAWGALAGMFIFACLRLWLAALSSKRPTPPTPES